MYEIICEKMKILAAYRADNPDIAKWLKQSDMQHWLYSLLKLKGETLSKRNVEDIIEGNIVGNAPLEAYCFAHHCLELRQDMENCVQLGSNVDVEMLKRWYSMLFERDAQYRTNNPIIYEWEHIPPHFDDLQEEVQTLFKSAYIARNEGNPIQRAAVLHLEFLRLYPFGEDTKDMGFVLLMYSLLQAGLPLPILTAGEREYNGLIADYTARKNAEPFVDMLERSLLNRIESALAICYQTGELPE